MTFRFVSSAQSELDAAVSYYEDIVPGLGLDFADEVSAAISRICEYPEAWPLVSKRARRCSVHRFPYGVIYQIVDGYVRVVAVAHLHRQPGYWDVRQ